MTKKVSNMGLKGLEGYRIRPGTESILSGSIINFDLQSLISPSCRSTSMFTLKFNETSILTKGVFRLGLLHTVPFLIRIAK
jgi:hypothetical protein